MTVKELFNFVSLEELEKACNIGTFSLGKKYKKSILYAYENIKKIISEQIDNIDNIDNDDATVTHVFISLSMDHIANEETIQNEEDLFYLSMTGFNPKNKFENYGLEFTPWEKILSYKIWDNSLNVFGKANCLVAIIYEMTFLGCDQETHIENTKKEEEILTERIEEIREHPENLISAEDFFSSFGYVDMRTKEDIEKEHAISNDIIKINIIHTIGLLGYDYFSDGEKYNTYMTEEDIEKVKELVYNNVKGFDLLNKCKKLFPKNTFVFNHIF